MSPSSGDFTVNDQPESSEKASESQRWTTIWASIPRPFRWLWTWVCKIFTYMCSNISRSSAAARRKLGGQFHASKIWAKKLPLISWFQKTFPDWKAGVVTAIVIATLTLVLNTAFLIWAIRKDSPGPNGLGTLFKGDCEQIGNWNKVGHGIINVISTCLLGLSNYCMQLLASPTRRSVDKAHRKRQWVDIGIQSFHNVWKRHISPWRIFFWTLLAISSAPLHLLWNSVIIFSPSAFRYNTIAVTEGFTSGLPFDDSILVGLSDSDEDGAHFPDNIHFLQQNLLNYETLSNIDCKRAYAKNFIQDRADVVVVIRQIKRDTNTSTILGSATGGFGSWPYKWLCPADSRQNFKCYGQLLQTGETWKFPGYEGIGNDVQYCLSQRIQERCKLEYGRNIALFVIAANVVKVVCFVVTYWIMKRHTSGESGPHKQHDSTLLITTGDAVASFLEVPDRTSLGMSIAEKKDFQNGIWNLRWVKVNPMPWYRRERCASFRAIGVRRWTMGILLLAIIPLAPGCYLIYQINWFINDLQLDKDAFTQLGIGKPSPLFLFGKWSNGTTLTSSKVLASITLANTPQLIVSIAYFFWNGHLTTMVAAREYDQFAAPIKKPNDGDEATDHEGGSEKTIYQATKRTLRVTKPIEGSSQKATRFLTVPFKYWALNVVAWTLLHYFASQAIFFARVDVLNHWQEATMWSISQVGYSILGLVALVASALGVFIFGMFIGLLRVENRMPLAATCSGALSAACHPADVSLNHHEKEVHWGVEVVEGLEGGERVDEDREGSRVRHCTFTSNEAFYPEEDVFYA